MVSANLTNKQRQAIYRRDGFRCALCDSTHGLQIHHVIPRSHGGSDKPQNLICLCWKCHAAAHGTIHPDFPEWVTQEWINQAATEYVSDWYAEQGIP